MSAARRRRARRSRALDLIEVNSAETYRMAGPLELCGRMIDGEDMTGMDLLVKIAKDRDSYVVWSSDEDWPKVWGTRLDLEELAPALAFERADERGIATIGSGRAPGWGGWDNPQGLQVGDFGVIDRAELPTMLERLADDPDADISDLLASFDSDDYDDEGEE